MTNSFLLQINVVGDSLNSNLNLPVVVPKEETLSIFQLLVQGGWYIMIPLALLSFLAIYIIIERLLTINKAQKEDTNFMNQIRDYIHDGKIESAVNLCRVANNPVSRMIEKGVSRIGKPLNDINTAIENVGKLEVARLEKGLSWLGTIAGAAPMIGFLGTVIGMIRTFHDMSTAGNQVEISNLAGGIMQAMITTAAGLVIGIVAYMGYNIMVAKVEKVVYKLEARTLEFMDLLHEPSK
ncbi:MAG: MotA/TolQ/ExbB proton channel family protein [Flavobacteriales bacterium]|nr:MotA/TolQ/ExbB proton channel family protein [Flavobacteriales bacterium]